MPQPPNYRLPGMNKPTPPNEKDDVRIPDSSRFISSPSMRRRIDIRGHTSPDPFDFRRQRMTEKRKPVLTDDYSEPVLVLQASAPRYLKPQFADQLDVDAEGQVRKGTIPALVERLMGTVFRSFCLR